MHLCQTQQLRGFHTPRALLLVPGGSLQSLHTLAHLFTLTTLLPNREAHLGKGSGLQIYVWAQELPKSLPELSQLDYCRVHFHGGIPGSGPTRDCLPARSTQLGTNGSSPPPVASLQPRTERAHAVFLPVEDS